jgi:hypothetical protein
MSEAEIPNPNARPEGVIPLRPTITPLTPLRLEESEWTTVNFPNAFDVDELVRRESIDRITIVEQHNQALHDRILYLEAALYEAQQEVQQEVQQEAQQQVQQQAQQHNGQQLIQPDTPPLTPPTAADPLTAGPQILAKHRQELTAAQAQSTKIFQELALAHQAAHRQQVLVETLTEQLKLGQERIAQLERECSTAQLRYSEQVQTVYQLEHSSHDLRSRLARQQRYTLQFKAALEKCLDVPPVNPLVDAQESLDSSLSESLGSTPAPIPINKLNIPKASPVQPWSAPSNADTAPDPSLQAWVNAFLSDSEFLPIDEPCPDNVVSLQDYSSQNDKSELNIGLDGASPFINLADPLPLPAHPLTDEAEIDSRFITLDSPAAGHSLGAEPDQHRLPSPTLWDGAIQPINVQVSTGIDPTQLDFRSPAVKAAAPIGAPALPKFAPAAPITPVSPVVVVSEADGALDMSVEARSATLVTQLFPDSAAPLDLFDDAPHLDVWAAEPSAPAVESLAAPIEIALGAESASPSVEAEGASVDPVKSPFITLTTSGRK